MKLIYIAGPFSGDIESNVRVAESVLFELADRGVAAICPHSIGRNAGSRGTVEFWYASTLEMASRCDALLLVGDWQSSRGTKEEIAQAGVQGKPVFESIDAVVWWTLMEE